MAAGSTMRPGHDGLERRLYVNAPPDAVWRALVGTADRTRTTGLAVLGAAELGWPAAGARRGANVRIGPLRVPVSAESLEARPARRFRLGFQGTSLAGEARWELAPAAGGTRVACRLSLEGCSRLGRVLLRLERRALPHRLEVELGQLKAVAEADVAQS